MQRQKIKLKTEAGVCGGAAVGRRWLTRFGGCGGKENKHVSRKEYKILKIGIFQNYRSQIFHLFWREMRADPKGISHSGTCTDFDFFFFISSGIRH